MSAEVARSARALSVVVLPIAVEPLIAAMAPLPRVDWISRASSCSSILSRSFNTAYFPPVDTF